MSTLDRSEINRALAKAIAYKQCGKDEKAQAWATELVRLLECSDIINWQYAARLGSLVEG
jgi:hypothetical protein